MKKESGKKRGRWAGLLAALVAVNLLASFVHYRMDLTEDKRYSLTPATRQLLQSLDDRLVVTVFLKGDYPAGFKKLSNSTEEFLRLLRETNTSQVTYRFVSPEEEAGGGKTWGDSLASMGAVPINLTVQVKSGQESKLVYPVALLQYKDQAGLVNIYKGSTRLITPQELNNAEAMMEYQFARTIDRLLHPDRPFVAYAVGNGEPAGPETYDLQQTLRNDYNLFTLDLQKQNSIPDTIKALLIVKPSTPFTDDQKLKIDQYVMRGGKVLWFVDNLFAEQDSLSFKAQLIAYERNLNLQDILFRYGVRLNPDLLMDLQCDFMPFAVGGSAGNPQYEFLHWNYFPLFESRDNHIINKNIGLVAGRFVNSIDTVEAEGIKKTFLLQSSANSRTISTPALISPNENRNAPEDALFQKNGLPAAVLLEGSFASLYRGRISRAQMDSLRPIGGFRDSGPADGKMIVAADGDLVLNDVSTRQGPLPMGMNLYTAGSQYEYQFANRDFLLNCLEYLTSKSSIIETRNKENVLRLLDTRKVEAEKTFWQLINIGLPLALVILAGVVYQYVRKRKFTSLQVHEFTS
ncbi:gliding motility-associated ABC transporter substrate-binding protein GldG [Paraflavisolibacter sp. H34]|uniref:gliding motility-associated ABC transporter substrate-binding protein GldG n=1 Tax=Huijunlia imazamoxiresistens TaxID=3127457 RepID=UPI0030164FB0